MWDEILKWLKDLVDAKPIDCQASNHDPVAMALSLVMIVGMAASYIPQHAKILVRRSSEGLSPYYFLLGSWSMAGILCNALLLQFGHIRCCMEQSGGQCFENLLGIVLIAVQFVSFSLLAFLFIVYFPKDRRYRTNLLTMRRQRTRAYSDALWTSALSLVSFVVMAGASVAVFLVYGDAQHSEITLYLAAALGLVAMSTSVVQFVPQIVKTWRRGRLGSLSIPTMFIQTPGSFLVVYSLASRPNSNITTWITYIVTGLLQGVLLCMAVVFWLRERRDKMASEEYATLLRDEADDVDGYEVVDVATPGQRRVVYNPCHGEELVIGDSASNTSTNYYSQ